MSRLPCTERRKQVSRNTPALIGDGEDLHATIGGRSLALGEAITFESVRHVGHALWSKAEPLPEWCQRLGTVPRQEDQDDGRGWREAPRPRGAGDGLLSLGEGAAGGKVAFQWVHWAMVCCPRIRREECHPPMVRRQRVQGTAGPPAALL